MEPQKPSLADLRIQRDERAEPRFRARPAILLALVLLLTGAAAWRLAWPRALAVHTVLARESAGGDGDHTVLNASGYVTARRAATVSAKITGKVVEVLIEEGMKVQEGQVLARLDDTNVKTSLRMAEAQLQSAKASLEQTRVRIREAEQEFERQKQLLKNKIAAQSDYDHAEASVLALKAQLVQQQADVVVAERQVASWQQQLEDTVIRAPFAGIVTTKDAQPGEMISPISAGGGFTRTGICTIVDMDSLEIDVDVNESYINRIEPGQPAEATLDAYPDWRIPCKVIAIIPTADRQKSTVKVRVGFDRSDPRILPEMSIKLAFQETGQAGQTAGRAVVVPKTALQQQDGRDVVMVVRNGRVERRLVTISSAKGSDASIVTGLTAGERVLVDWPAGLADGAAVRETESKR